MRSHCEGPSQKGWTFEKTCACRSVNQEGHTESSKTRARLISSSVCRYHLQMGGKAKPTKHTAAEIKAKVFAATVNRGGGAQGLADRKGGKVGHAKYK